MIELARGLFPGAYVVAHTAPRIRHDDRGRAIATFIGHQVGAEGLVGGLLGVRCSDCVADSTAGHRVAQALCRCRGSPTGAQPMQ